MDNISTLLHGNPLLSTGILVSIMGALFISLKQLPLQIYNRLKDRFVFTATVYQTDPLYIDFEAWFFAHYKNKYRYVEAVSEERNHYNEPIPMSPKNSKERSVIYKQIDGIFFIRVKGRVILITKNREKLEHSNDVRSLYLNAYHFKCVGGSAVIKELLNECISFNAKKDNSQLRIFSHNEYGDWYISGRVTAKDINNVVLPASIKENIINDIDAFETSKDWYTKSAIFYKRGHLYHGLPGNGKTSLSMAIASYMGKDIYCLDLNAVSDNSKLKLLFANLNNGSVLLIEDIDGFYNLREPVKKDSKISFSTLLNCMDGAFYKEGLFTIITTNNIHMVDAAIRRPGRMDLEVEIPNPGIEEINIYLKNFFGDDAPVLRDYTLNLSMSQVQGICLRHKDKPEMCLMEFEDKSCLSVAV